MARITKAALDRHRAITLEAIELGRKARALQSEARAIESAAKADLVSSGRELVTRGGYKITMVEGKASIAWKDELVSRLGAEVAIQIAAAAPKTRKLQITPPTL